MMVFCHIWADIGGKCLRIPCRSIVMSLWLILRPFRDCTSSFFRFCWHIISYPGRIWCTCFHCSKWVIWDPSMWDSFSWFWPQCFAFIFGSRIISATKTLHRLFWGIFIFRLFPILSFRAYFRQILLINFVEVATDHFQSHQAVWE